MGLLTVTYHPGFQEDLTSWWMRFEADGRVKQEVDICRFTPFEKSTEAFSTSISTHEIAELRRLISAVNFEAVAQLSSQEIVDDAEEASFEAVIAGHVRRFSCPIEWLEFRAERGEALPLEWGSVLALWRWVLARTPYRKK